MNWMAEVFYASGLSIDAAAELLRITPQAAKIALDPARPSVLWSLENSRPESLQPSHRAFIETFDVCRSWLLKGTAKHAALAKEYGTGWWLREDLIGGNPFRHEPPQFRRRPVDWQHAHVRPSALFRFVATGRWSRFDSVRRDTRFDFAAAFRAKQGRDA